MRTAFFFLAFLAFGLKLSAQQEVFTVKDDKVIKESAKPKKAKPAAKPVAKPVAKTVSKPVTKTVQPKAIATAKPKVIIKPEAPAKPPVVVVETLAAKATPPKTKPEVLLAKADTTDTEVIQYAYIAEGKAISTNATRKAGPYFKVQFASVKEPNQAGLMLKDAEIFGRIDTEYLFENKLTRLLIGDYTDAAKASDAAKQLKTKGFKEAFVVVYQDGMRQKSYALK